MIDMIFYSIMNIEKFIDVIENKNLNIEKIDFRTIFVLKSSYVLLF